MNEMNREDAKEIRIPAGVKIDDVVVALDSLRRISTEVFFVEFNGVKLYSDNITLDDAYLQVYGCTKRELDEAEKNWDETAKMSEEQAKSMITERFEEGKKYMYPERSEEWKKWLEFRAESATYNQEGVKYPGMIIECLKRLENGEDFETVFEFVKSFSEMDHDMGTASTLLDFSKVGPEYFEYVYKKKMGSNLSGEILKSVEAKKEENRKLAEIHKEEKGNQSQERKVSVSEIKEVAEGQTIGSKNEATNAVTSPTEEKIQAGQSHDEK